MDDDDDFGGFEAAEGGDDVAQVTVSPAIPWAALSSVPGTKLVTNAPPDILMDQPPSYQTDSLEPGPQEASTDQHQVFPSHDGSIAVQNVASADSPDTTEAQEAHSQVQQVVSSLQAQLSASEEEKARIQQDLEEMMAKQARMGEVFQKEKGAETDLHRRRYAELQGWRGSGLWVQALIKGRWSPLKPHPAGPQSADRTACRPVTMPRFTAVAPDLPSRGPWLSRAPAP
ncbi:hypothetical protein SKAU_G00041310 [Synaphobranchus kaupii]|uniref:Uncharacterized protein n=1 Tax=Synaphobranchus kaupii TaxID=118154 RepID=A0A9Q1G1Z5_SYNKA|nr:hypothetical protein SKAU_G00041310 [Synaphobranchus kaupii]